MEFSCVAAGSFHQGDPRFTESNNAQCMANATCALAWQAFCGGFSTNAIDAILMAGDSLYTLSRREHSITNRYLFPEDLARHFVVAHHRVTIEEISCVWDGLYPLRNDGLDEVTSSLSSVLEAAMPGDSVDSGFLFTGQLVTVAFWRFQGRLYLFDSHAVNENRRRDIDEARNKARVFVCNSFRSLASLILVNSAFVGGQYSVTKIKFSVNETQTVHTVDCSDNDLTQLSESASETVVQKTKCPGRPKTIKRGRPKLLDTTREEQVDAAKKKYRETHADKLRDDSQRYTQTHPEVHRKAVQQYDLRNPGASAERVQIFRLKNPKMSELRYMSASLARSVVKNGPMSVWNGEPLNEIQPYKLKKVSLWVDDVYRCRHCQGRLFEEEKNRKQWCCGEGAFNVLDIPPLQERFYSDRLFLERARAYNDLFAFCALEVSGGYRHPSGLSFFKIEGRMYHQVYNLDAPGQKFTTRSGNVQFVNRSRLYIDDGEERRNIAMGRSLDAEIIDGIADFLSRENPYIEHYRRLSNEPSVTAHLAFEVTSRSTHGPVLGDRQTGVEVHAVLSNDENDTEPRRLTIWKSGSDRPTFIDLLHPLMEPFQYPLLYPQGTVGWHVGRLDNKGAKLTQFKYSRCLLLSEPRFSHLGRLSQAWQVEMFARYEEEKLRYIKFTQLKNTDSALRVGPVDEIRNAQQVLNDIARDETVQGEGGVQAGKVYLPSSFTGGPRYMKVKYEDAMAIISRLGSPTFFLTFTYNATWEENKKACPRGGTRSDPSTACRVFRIKLLELLRDLRSGAMFGRSVYIVYVIEMQMRGLPHAHIVFKIDGDGPVQASEIDSIIRADIPSEEEAGGRLRKLVLKHMIHGPCGNDHRTDFLCWDSAKGYCTKYFPKPCCETTHVDERGFVQYKRDYTNRGTIVSRNKNIIVHDGWVVPYNPALMLKYEAHINLELASTRRVIKYLFKYLMKGGSLQNVTVTPFSKQDDEVQHYVTKRMVGASDACWRLLNFPVSESEPAVECLPVHLEGKQSVLFRPGQLAEAAARNSSKLTIYFDRPRISLFDDLTYQGFYETFVVHVKRPKTAEIYEHPDGVHFITARQRGEKVCRLFWVSPSRTEQYYLRILLMTVSCRGYADLLSRGGPNCRTFQGVARHLGLVQDEQEYHYALREAATFMTGPRLRSFFVILCNMGAPAALLWDAFRDSICEDHIERNPLDVELAYKLGLIDIDRSLRRQGSCVADHGLPDVHDDTTELGRELLLHGENQQRVFVEEWVPKLSEDQNRVFEYVTSVLNAPASGTSSKIIFLDGPGGYGKTTLIRVILAYVRGCRQVALAVASSGTAAGNMPGGTTAHSMFRLPLDFGDGTGFWNITNGSQRAELIRAARLIVFDEAPMAHRFVFEVLDRSLRDLMRSSELFGGKIFLCCGDFRQIAPVVVNARTPTDIVCVSLRASHLWQHFKIFALTTAHRTSSSTAYSEFLLRVGNGTVSSTTFLEGRNEQSLIPLLGIRQVTSLTDLVDSVFPANVLLDSDMCSRRAILSTLIVNVKEINDHILNSLDGHLYELRSADTVDRENDDGLDVDVQLLNTATGKGVPDHVLRLKIGSVCLIMRNLNIAEGLVNGTKVIVIGITNRLITVRLPGQTQPIGIPRITFTFAFVEGSPLRVRRRQFPLMLAYCMTGHKSQGQTIDSVGVDLRTDCFTHGQLYVLLSRVRHPDHIVVLVHPERVRDGIAYAKNIVYGDLLL
ncbi:uncharacterized protein LOC129003305 [Macrosteles quadrilineatus]|uniref:uncharacterized protein LOC129003305 n=1 Tax=Macrosteles quadrilineatus TaxID=74068 RepID=UPI0023E1D4F4|nr:uncharacterized protein LOC129003305 [Macrosteles quadrilineatus]